MKTITLFFQNNETRTVVTIKPEQLKQFEISEIRTKWKMQNGQNQPISVIENSRKQSRYYHISCDIPYLYISNQEMGRITRR